MKSREEVARFVEDQMYDRIPCSNKGKICTHYGYCELRDLMDFIYGSPPKSETEKVFNQSKVGKNK